MIFNKTQLVVWIVLKMILINKLRGVFVLQISAQLKFKSMLIFGKIN